ncbi:MAG TPA: type II toxin-antitoxin system VapC family toxin, partial [Longimicrobiaceae bacterium]|nr:type II toxin-antitoxin system VapC family toxin [Longimicrobiaceae bacterium]
DTALQITAVMQQSVTIELDAALAMRAAKVSVSYRLPLADSIIYATSLAFGATLWTQDTDFETLAGVRYLPKRRSGQGSS